MSTFLFGDDWRVHLARGKLRNALHIHKFAANNAPANGVEETVWDGSTLYPWATTWDLGAANVHLKSDDEDDAGITVFIQGLDADFNVQSETVTLDATDPTTTAVASQNTYSRLFRMYNTSSQQEVGDISAHYGTSSGIKIAQITSGEGQTLMGVYTVPAGHIGLLMHYEFAGSANSAITSRLQMREPNGVFRTMHKGATYGGQYEYIFGVPVTLAEKTDVDLRVTAGTGSALITGTFNLVLVKENEFNEWSAGY